MGVLTELLKDPTKRRAIVNEGVKVIEAEVNDKGGLRGAAVKLAFKAVQGVKPGFIPMALDNLIGPFAEKVDPFYDAWKAGGKGTLREYFVANGPQIANALLSITDERAARADNKVVRGAYEKLRPQGVEHTVAAMPRLADLIARFAG